MIQTTLRAGPIIEFSGEMCHWKDIFARLFIR